MATADQKERLEKEDRPADRARNSWALFVYTALSLFLTYPLVLHLADSIREHADQYEYAWLTSYVAQRLFTNPLALFDGNMYYPFAGSLAYSDSTLGSVLIALPVLIATGNPILANNLLLLLSFILAGYGVYLLVFHYTRNWPAAILAGFIFSFAPFRMDHIAQIPNFSSQWIPFALYGLLRFWEERRWRWAWLFGLAFSLQALASFYFAYVVAMLCALYLLIKLWQNPRRLLDKQTVVPFLTVSLLSAVVIGLVALPYFGVQERYGFHRTVEEASFFGATLGNFFAVPPENRLYGSFLADGMERVLFPGIAALALALLGVFAGGGRADRLYYVAAAGAAFVLALGPDLHITSVERSVALPLGLKLPYWYLYEYLPGFQALRVPTRFGIVIILSVAVLAGFGMSYLFGRIRSRLGGATLTTLTTLASLAIGAIILAEYAMIPLHFVRVPVGAGIPEVYRYLQTLPAKGVLCELPINMIPDEQAPYTYYSTYHGWTLVNGNRSFSPPMYKALAQALDLFPEPGAIDRLQTLGARYAILHGARYEPAELGRRLSLADTQPDRLGLVGTFGDDRLYEILATDKPPAAAKIETRVAIPGVMSAGSTARLRIAWESSEKHALVLTEADAKLVGELVWTGVAGPSSQQPISEMRTPLSRGLERVIAASDSLDLDIVAPTEPGEYRLALRMDTPSPLAPKAPVESIVLVLPADSKAPPDRPGEVRIVSAALDRTIAAPGDTLSVAVALQPERALTLTSSLALNVFDREGRYWSHQASNGGSSLSLNRAMRPGEKVEGALQTRLDEAIPPGAYTVEIALTSPLTGDRQPIPGNDGTLGPAYEVGQFVVLPPERTGADLAPRRPLAVEFENGLALFGWSEPGEAPFVSADALRLRLHYGMIDAGISHDRASVRPGLPYTAFLHVVDSSGKLVAQRDAQPFTGDYPTSLWTEGTRLSEEWTVPLPVPLPRGEYRVIFGWYDGKSLKRLAVLSGGSGTSSDTTDSVEITRFTIP